MLYTTGVQSLCQRIPEKGLKRSAESAKYTIRKQGMKNKIELFIGKEVKIVFQDKDIKEGVLKYDDWLDLYSVVGKRGAVIFTKGSVKKIRVLK